MDFITLKGRRGPLLRTRWFVAYPSRNRARRLSRLQNGMDIKKLYPLAFRWNTIVFNTRRIFNNCAQHLVAATDSYDYSVPRIELLQGSNKTVLLKPCEIVKGLFTAGKNHHVSLQDVPGAIKVGKRY